MNLGAGVVAFVLKTGFFPLCFVVGILIETDTGLCLIEELVLGDRIVICDVGL